MQKGSFGLAIPKLRHTSHKICETVLLSYTLKSTMTVGISNINDVTCYDREVKTLANIALYVIKRSVGNHMHCVRDGRHRRMVEALAIT